MGFNSGFKGLNHAHNNILLSESFDTCLSSLVIMMQDVPTDICTL